MDLDQMDKRNENEMKGEEIERYGVRLSCWA